MPRWSFLDAEADVAGAVGLHKLRLKERLNKVSDVFDGRNVSVPIDANALGAPPIRLRQTIRIGDDCATAVITCVANPSNTSLKCGSVPAAP